MNYKPIRFIEEPIEVSFIKEPVFEKKPECPNAFIWRDEEYVVEELLSEWQDYQRKGRMTRNMKPTHLSVAGERGSWGVGQFYFRVKTHPGTIFDIYYDRAPKNVDNRKGSWTIYRQLEME